MRDLSPAAQQLLTAAIAARGRADAVGERAALDRALDAAPGHPQVLNARGMRALADQDPAVAIAAFEGAIVADPGQPILWLNLATAQRLAGNMTEERRALDGALAIDQRVLTAHLRLAELEERLGNDIASAQRWAAVVQLAQAMPDRSPAIADALARGHTFLAGHGRAVEERVKAAFADAAISPDVATRRVAASMDHLLGRRQIYTNVCSGLHVPFLPADEFFDRQLFPWFEAIERQTDAIRAEALALLASGTAAIRPYVRQDAGTPRNQWSALDNSVDWSACFLWEYGVRNDDVCDRCPVTAATLAAVPQNDSPGKAPTAFFSILRPHTHIPAHTGVTNSRAIVHLPLVVPDGCRFRVGGETRSWVEGEAFAFDDTIEHEAWNDSEAPRIVLIFDIWNPHLTAEEQSMLKLVFQSTGQGGVAP